MLCSSTSLTFDVDHIVAVANLPYNIGTPLLLKWMDRIALFDVLVLMFQREVARAPRCGAGSGAYGRLSVLVQWLCEVEVVMHLPGGAFVPPPQVASSLVRLTPRPQPLAPRTNGHSSACSRRIRPASQDAAGQPQEPGRRAPELLAAAQVPPTARAEEIDVEGFAASHEATSA